MDAIDNTAIDLSFRSTTQVISSHNTKPPPIHHHHHVPLVRPIPRLPWTITWYQSVWSNQQQYKRNCANLSETFQRLQQPDDEQEQEDVSFSHSRSISPGQFEDFSQRFTTSK